jgi:DMSO/TMAO reductase YedYZ molybdopterin-dependent catalytic subunit
MTAKPASPALTRRDVLVGAGASALLAACGETAAGATQGAADAGSSGDAATSTDAAVGTAQDAALTYGDPLDLPQALDAITPNQRFYITSCCGTPETDAATWSFDVLDRGKLLATIDLKFLESLQPRDKEHTLECIGGGPPYQLISNAIWTGLPLPEILAAKGVTVPVSVPELKITSLDDFSTGLPVSDLDLPIWLVWRVGGQPLPPAHGYPARLLVPNRYGMKNPKWLKAIEFVDQPYLGFWETQGWSKTAYYRPNAYIQSPKMADALKPGLVRVLGTAFAGRDPVAKVEISVDSGPWQAAVLDYSGKQDVWTLWHFDWPAGSGVHTIQARCITASGAMSDPKAEGTNPLSGYDGSMTISLTVA